jgi:hypothetical protein
LSGIFDRFRDYDFKYWVTVQAEAADAASIHRLFSLRDALGHNAWFLARDRRNEIEGYVSDLRIAQDLADTAASLRGPNRANALGLQCLYALVEATVHDLAGHHLPALAARYVKAGLWTRDQALSWARLANDPQSALKTVVDALRHDTPGKREEFAQLALTIGADILDPDGRVLAVAELAVDLPEHLLHRALNIVAEEGNEGSRLGGLRKLAPRLSSRLKLQALEVARKFNDVSLRLSAIVGVAESLEDPERTKIFSEVLTDVRRAIERRAIGTESGNLRLGDLARDLPDDCINQLDALMTDAVPEDVRQAVRAEVIERKAADNPVWARAQASQLPVWRRGDTLAKAALAFARLGRFKEAAGAFRDIAAWVGRNKEELLAELLWRVPPSEETPFVELYEGLSADECIRVLRLLASFKEMRLDLLRALADSAALKGKKLEGRTAIARVLGVEEVDEAFKTLMNAPEDRSGDQALVDLTPFLTVDHIRQALPLYKSRSSLSMRDPLTALVVRLADLGEWREAVCHVAECRDILESNRAEVLLKVAEHSPDECLRAVLDVTRPHSAALDVALARAALSPWLDSSAVEVAVTQAQRLDSVDRLRALSALALALPPNRLRGLLQSLMAALADSFPSRHFDLSKFLEEGFSALSRVLAFSHASEDEIDHAIALARTESVSDAWQIRLLASLASVGGEYPHAKRALVEAFAIRAADSKHILVRARVLSAAHSVALGALVRDLDNPLALVPLLHAAAHLLDARARKEAIRRLFLTPDWEQRFLGLAALLPHLSRQERDKVARAALAQKRDWSSDPTTFVLGMSVLAPYAPKLVAPHLAEVLKAHARLEPVTQVSFAVSLAQGHALAEKFVDVAFAAIDRVRREARLDSIVLLAPVLNRSQIASLLASVVTEAVGDPVPVFVALLSRAAELEELDVVRECFSALDNEFTRAKVIERAACNLPYAALCVAAQATDHLGALGELAVRAASLGDLDLAWSCLERRTARMGDDNLLMQRVYRAAPPAEVEALIEKAQAFDPYSRAYALVEVVDRVGKSQRQKIIETIIDALQAFRGTRSTGRIDTMRLLHPHLQKLPADRIASMWKDALARSRAGSRREDVLVDVRAFAPILAAHFGPKIAPQLDAALSTAGGEYWP